MNRHFNSFKAFLFATTAMHRVPLPAVVRAPSRYDEVVVTGRS